MHTILWVQSEYKVKTLHTVDAHFIVDAQYTVGAKWIQWMHTSYWIHTTRWVQSEYTLQSGCTLHSEYTLHSGCKMDTHYTVDAHCKLHSGRLHCQCQWGRWPGAAGCTLLCHHCVVPPSRDCHSNGALTADFADCTGALFKNGLDHTENFTAALSTVVTAVHHVVVITSAGQTVQSKKWSI